MSTRDKGRVAVYTALLTLLFEFVREILPYVIN